MKNVSQVIAPKQRLSVVMLNWKRSDNIIDIAVTLQANPVVGEVLIWNNNPAQDMFPATAEVSEKVKVVNSSHNLGIYPRYAFALLAENDFVMIQDDDLRYPAASIEEMFNSVQANPDCVHGTFGREPKADGTYADFYDHDDRKVEMVIGRTMVFHKSNLWSFFKFLDTKKAAAAIHAEAIRLGCLPSSCDDIMFSYAVYARSGRKNTVLNVLKYELSSKEGVSDNPNHYKLRQFAMNACRKELGLK